MSGQKNQPAWYSGKKKRHTLKAQVVVHAVTRAILCVAIGKGATHDLTLFQDSGIAIHPETELLADAAYQGFRREHACSRTPAKSPKSVP